MSCSGIMRPGLNAILGPTGSGKSSWVSHWFPRKNVFKIVSCICRRYLSIALFFCSKILGYSGCKEGSFRSLRRSTHRQSATASKLQMPLWLCGSGAFEQFWLLKPARLVIVWPLVGRWKQAVNTTHLHTQQTQNNIIIPIESCLFAPHKCRSDIPSLVWSTNSWDKYLALQQLNAPVRSPAICSFCQSAVWCWAGTVQWVN